MEEDKDSHNKSGGCSDDESEQPLSVSFNSKGDDISAEKSVLDRQLLDFYQNLEMSELEHKSKTAMRWATFRQIIILSIFSIWSTGLTILGFYALYTLMSPRDANDKIDTERRETARLIFETECGAVVAGLVGYSMVKSFEK